ncbi:hypothetical protein AI3057V1_1454 [Citrobacter freundii]|uniref:hypothetical protein n=1 Tax=Citrobacter freundii TaxID=546 RepID=UPI001D8A82A9|nr:hypothetical protein [Citrobacter freundii]CAG0338750.1 hypothetical protein AI3057V1_1454 [Citrobacter freundii]CAH6019224.1 hypothetical protein AI3057V1_1454 [Citrobacter freundii]
MIFPIVKTVYINSKTDSHLMRYDVITVDSDTYLVKVFDNQQRGLSTPDLINQIAEFEITRADYNAKYQVGNRAIVKMNMDPGFENTIDAELQAHRDSLS